MNKAVLGFDNILSNGQEIVGNKAYNLALLSKEVSQVNYPMSIVLPFDEKDNASSVANDLFSYIPLNISYPLIVRSSTNVEDSGDSFAGLFLSEICQNESEVMATIDCVMKSIYSDEVRACLKSFKNNG